ncbi:hypothetical protein KIW84_012508 [Lathyrus oleraceus]|uniref:Uncharacterized protein n=1 Tax=Pisum sativum TaxID=3888 RepID=A0A9D5BHZ0_PEA|nr:hypothetical protein KIW84_012508 [Pisum sativum]
MMALKDDFEGLRGGILHRNPLPNVDSIFDELLTEETRLKSHSNLIPNKGVLSNPQSIFVAQFHKGKPQASKKNFKSLSSNVVAAPTTIGSGFDHVYPSETTSQIAGIAEKLQKLLATQSCAMSASSVKGLNSSCLLGISPSMYILDYGASHHMSYDAKSFMSLNTAPSMSIMTADGTHMPLADPHFGRLIEKGRRQGGHYVLDELRVPDTETSTSSSTTYLFSKLTHIDPFGHNDNISSDCNFENHRIDTTTTTPDTDIPLVYSIIPSVTTHLSDNRVVGSSLELNVKYAPSDSVPLPYPTLYLHWEAVLRTCRYLQGTQFQSLLFPSLSSLELRAYFDADWASDPTDRKSTTEFCIFLGDSFFFLEE